MLIVVLAFDLVVDFDDAAANQKQPADEENQVANRDVVDVRVILQPVGEQARLAERRKQRLREPHDPGDRKQQQNSRAHCRQQANPAGQRLLARRQATADDRDEDDVVDAQDDFHRRQGDQGDRVVEEGFHRFAKCYVV